MTVRIRSKPARRSGWGELDVIGTLEEMGDVEKPPNTQSMGQGLADASSSQGRGSRGRLIG
jgi:hypothetical protein